MKSVIILGTAPSHTKCPYDCETWGVNGAYTAANFGEVKDRFRLDKLFITDYLFRPDGTFCFDIDTINALFEKHGTQVISLHDLRLGGTRLNASRYPYKRITEKFGTNYFTSSIDYMLAYAIDKDYECIKTFGCDMITPIEYAQQRAGMAFWIGMAMMKGCTVEISEGSAVMAMNMNTPYGWKPKIDLKMIDPYGLLSRKGGK